MSFVYRVVHSLIFVKASVLPNLFHATGLFVYPFLDLWFSDVFSGYIHRDMRHAMG